MSDLYDLHTHSYCSDGKLSPANVVKLASENGVTALALTDHDSIAGIAEAQLAADELNADLQIIPGIEFSSQWNGRGIHIVGLQVDVDSPVLQAAVAQQAKVRIERAETIAKRLEKAGIEGALAGAQHYANGGVIGRPHFAQYLIEKGHVSNFAQAFKRYLGSGKAGDVKQGWPEIQTVIQWINDSGGIAVLAHPDKYDLTRTKLYKLLQDFTDAGGQALEVVSGKQDKAVTDKLKRAADDFSLLASCGSDFHAEGQPWQSLGQFSVLPEACTPVWSAFKKVS